MLYWGKEGVFLTPKACPFLLPTPEIVHEDMKMGSDGESDQASATSSDEVQSPVRVRMRNHPPRKISTEVLDLCSSVGRVGEWGYVWGSGVYDPSSPPSWVLGHQQTPVTTS